MGKKHGEHAITLIASDDWINTQKGDFLKNANC